MADGEGRHDQLLAHAISRSCDAAGRVEAAAFEADIDRRRPVAGQACNPLGCGRREPLWTHRMYGGGHGRNCREDWNKLAHYRKANQQHARVCAE